MNENILGCLVFWVMVSIFVALGGANTLTDLYKGKKDFYIYHILLIIMALPTLILFAVCWLIIGLFTLKIKNKII